MNFEFSDIDKIVTNEVSGTTDLNEQSVNSMNGVNDADIIENIALSEEGVKLEPEIRTDVPDCDVALVTGNPYELADEIDFNQGDNPYNAAGNCGLVSISNMLRRAGMDVTEDDVTKCAIKNGLCNYDPNGDEAENGGTNIAARQAILKEFGVPSDIYPSGRGGSLEKIADAVDNGQGVVISVNAGELWNCDDGSPTFFGISRSNHCVAVTGIARDAESGEIKGVYIADSGRGLEEDSCRYLSVDEFDDVYTNVIGSGANITKDAIMEV